MGVESHPDIITMAKPLANGYPIGAVLMRECIAKSMTAGRFQQWKLECPQTAETEMIGSHGTTFGGSALGCRMGMYVLERVSEDKFVRQIRSRGEELGEGLRKVGREFEGIVSEIRGRGLIRGIAFVEGRENQASRVVKMARERGVLLLSAGSDAVRCVPSLTVGSDEIAAVLDVLRACLREITSQ